MIISSEALPADGQFQISKLKRLNMYDTNELLVCVVRIICWK